MFEIVEIGKSVFMINQGTEEFFGKLKSNINNSLFRKSFIAEHIVSVPQTDTGALVEYTKASGRQQFKELGNKN